MTRATFTIVFLCIAAAAPEVTFVSPRGDCQGFHGKNRWVDNIVGNLDIVRVKQSREIEVRLEQLKIDATREQHTFEYSNTALAPNHGILTNGNSTIRSDLIGYRSSSRLLFF